MDTSECQPLYLDIQVFYESINMKVEQKIPLLLVERQALNEAMDGERNVSQHFFPSFNLTQDKTGCTVCCQSVNLTLLSVSQI